MPCCVPGTIHPGTKESGLGLLELVVTEGEVAVTDVRSLLELTVSVEDRLDTVDDAETVVEDGANVVGGGLRPGEGADGAEVESWTSFMSLIDKT